VYSPQATNKLNLISDGINSVKTLIGRLKYLAKNVLWMLNGHFGHLVSLETPEKVTVLITYFNPLRMKKINHQVRNILKCTFVEKVIISNHNSDVHINEILKIDDKRLAIISQDQNRACGYRWRVAKNLDAKYLVVIDDDILLFPYQLGSLCENLFHEPEIPHGFSGMVKLANGDFQYRERENIEVDYLCEVYGLTQDHVCRYFELENILAREDSTLPEAIEYLGDFIVISKTGPHNSKIHNVGKLLRSETFKTPGLANHKKQEFAAILVRVSQAVENIQPQIFSSLFKNPIGRCS